MANKVLNPCPTCGNCLDVGGCMTFVAYFLEEFSDGKCPGCGTVVLIEVPEPKTVDAWAVASSSEVPNVRFDDMDLSVRTKNSMRQLNIATVGDLLALPRQHIIDNLPVSEPVLHELDERLSEKKIVW